VRVARREEAIPVSRKRCKVYLRAVASVSDYYELGSYKFLRCNMIELFERQGDASEIAGKNER
jgi:hypothetical protein